jgi:low affinity Fe/Cu permease
VATDTLNTKSLKARIRSAGLTPGKLPEPISPALAKHAEEQASKTQTRIADSITRFAGSMAFVYIHIVWFSTWIGFGVEKYPFGLLTMIVSLEAIFLSTFVMISQNRSDAKRQVVADEQWTTVQEEDQQNRQLLDISNQILELTKAVNTYVAAAGHGQADRADPNGSAPASSGNSAAEVRDTGS